jgi:polysaccharide export outer membrane protein
MPMILKRTAALLTAALIGLAGCGDRPPLSDPVPNVEGPYRLDTGDELRVVVYDEPTLTNLYEVDQAGMVALPLIGDVPARGSTTEELAGRIAARLAANYLRNPDVTVEVATYRPFFVLGEVGSPGQYTYVPGMTAETAVAVAGGFTDRANGLVVRISRTVNGTLYEGEIAITEAIRPGDTIYVYESLF